MELEDGLNILTGETGAGKSIMIGFGKSGPGAEGLQGDDPKRRGVRLRGAGFLSGPGKEEALRALDVVPDENGILIISRKIMASRSLSRINDETVTAARLKQVTSLLIDIHGQHEHQSLLHALKTSGNSGYLRQIPGTAAKRTDGSSLYRVYPSGEAVKPACHRQ